MPLPRDTTIRGPYGDRPDAHQPNPPDRATLADGFHDVPPDTKVRIRDANMRDSPAIYNAYQQRLDNEADQETPVWASIAAGVYRSTGGDIYRRLTKPEFADDPPLERHQFLEQLPLRLTEDEREFFDKHARGVNSAKWAIKEIRNMRGADNLIADNPGSALIGGFLDPVNAVPVLGASRITKGLVGRAKMAAATAGTNYGLEKAGTGVVSDEDTLLNVMIGATFGWAAGGRAALKQVNAQPVAQAVAPTTVHPVAPQGTITPTGAAGPAASVPPTPTAPPAGFMPGSTPPPVSPAAFVAPVPTPPPSHLRLTLPVPTKAPTAPPGPPTAASALPEYMTRPQAELQRLNGLLRDIRSGAVPPTSSSKTQYIRRVQERIRVAEAGYSVGLKRHQDAVVARHLPMAPPEVYKAPKDPYLDGTKTWEFRETPPVALQKALDSLRELADNPTKSRLEKKRQLKRMAELEETAQKLRSEFELRAAVRRADTSPIQFKTKKERQAARKRWTDAARTARKREEAFRFRLNEHGPTANPAAGPAPKAPTKAPKDAFPSPTKAPEAPGKVDTPPTPTEPPVRPSEVFSEGLPEYINLESLDADSVVKSDQNGYPTIVPVAAGQNPSSGVPPTQSPPGPGSAPSAPSGASGGGAGAVPPVTPAQPPAGGLPPPLAGINPNAPVNPRPRTTSQAAGQNIAWNMHKTMSSYGDAGKQVADLLFDDALEPGKVSIESVREGILSDLREYQRVYEDLVLAEMGHRGWTLARRIKSPTEAFQAQRALEKELYLEMVSRQTSQRNGVPHRPTTQNPHILEMADSLDRLSKEALGELQRAGVDHAQHLQVAKGFVRRRWESAAFERVIQRIGANGSDVVRDLLAQAIQKHTPQMPDGVANQMAAAIRDRALRKGYFEDSVGQGTTAQQRAMLADAMRQAGVPDHDIHNTIQFLLDDVDKTSGPGYLKSRIGMDMTHSITLPTGETLRVLDLVDTNISQLTDVYIKSVSTDAAFARKGITKSSDVLRLREFLLKGVGPEKRGEAADLFDNTIAYFKGLPQGAAVNQNFRRAANYGRTVALAFSGLWQVIEFGTVLAQYGLVNTTKAALQNVPGFSSLFGAHAKRLTFLLSEHSERSVRLRPFLGLYEDGHGMSMAQPKGWGIAHDLQFQQLGNLVPYANGMKFIHSQQAKIVANLIGDRLRTAVSGNSKAADMLARYGIDDAVLARVKPEMDAHGWNVDDWSDEAWDAVRPGLYRMMDESVLKGRLGDLPAFAAFDPVGKVLFTYRSFILAAHNKLLAGTLATSGLGALALMFMYQFPLAVLATQAQNQLMGRDSEDPVTGAIAQIGVMGLFSEPFKWATGQSNSVGAPVLIPFDRGVQLFQAGLSGNAGELAGRGADMVPVVAANPVVRAISESMKE